MKQQKIKEVLDCYLKYLEEGKEKVLFDIKSNNEKELDEVNFMLIRLNEIKKAIEVNVKLEIADEIRKIFI